MICPTCRSSQITTKHGRLRCQRCGSPVGKVKVTICPAPKMKVSDYYVYTHRDLAMRGPR